MSGRQTAKRRMIVLLSCLALGLTSFASPIDRAEGQLTADDPRGTWHHVASVTPEKPGCPVDSAASFDRESAVARAAEYFHSHRSRMTDAEIHQVAEAVVDCARHNELDPDLVVAVIHVESRGNTYALSPVGAMGLMQIMPPTGEELANELGIQWVGAKLLFEPEVNVRLGVTYLRQLQERFGSWSTALAAYNWGPGQISRRIRTGVALPVGYSTSVLTAKHNDI